MFMNHNLSFSGMSNQDLPEHGFPMMFFFQVHFVHHDVYHLAQRGLCGALRRDVGGFSAGDYPSRYAGGTPTSMV